MKIEDEFPLIYYINLAKRQDRRAHAQEEFWRHSLQVERFPAINARWVKHCRGMWNEGRYACSLSQRLAIRKARQLGAKSVLLFEDDVALHENFREIAEAIELPEDWGIFYFGCQHIETPIRVKPGIVRATRALDMHAVAIRAEYFDTVIRALTPPGKGKSDLFDPSDVCLANLNEVIPSYAASPNLAWQRENHSDLANRTYSNYYPNGVQGAQGYKQEGYWKFLQDELAHSNSVFSGSGLKLHLGCGNNRLEGWANLEIQQVDVREPLQFQDGSARFLFLEHVIEHITPRNAYRFFVECLRVLENGGVLRLAFPCIDKVWSAQSEAYAEFLASQGWGTADQKSAIETLIFEHGHEAVWTERSMCIVLESLGFEVATFEVGKSDIPELCGLEQHGNVVGEEINAVETACIEAKKPVDWVDESTVEIEVVA